MAVLARQFGLGERRRRAGSPDGPDPDRDREDAREPDHLRGPVHPLRAGNHSGVRLPGHQRQVQKPEVRAVPSNVTI